MSSGNSTRRKRLLRIILLCLAPFAFYCLFKGVYYWHNAGRSQDRSGVLIAMIQLKFSEQKIISIGGRPDMLLAKSEYGEKHILNSYMRDLGWQYIDQGGSASYFRKGNRKRVVAHLAMTRHFFVYTLKPPYP